MISEIIEEIKAEEEKANKLTQDAKSEAREMVKGVEAALSEEMRNVSQENRQYVQNRLEQTKKDFSVVLNDVSEKKRAEEKENIEKYRNNIDAAAEYIVKRVLEHGYC